MYSEYESGVVCGFLSSQGQKLCACVPIDLNDCSAQGSGNGGHNMEYGSIGISLSFMIHTCDRLSVVHLFLLVAYRALLLKKKRTSHLYICQARSSEKNKLEAAGNGQQ